MNGESCDGPEGLPAYARDAYLSTIETEVVRSGEDGSTAWVELADTVCYPEGGGQPADHGRVGGVPVTDVQKRGGAIRHVLAGPSPKGVVTVELDWVRRYDHMQQHTGQHLLTAVAADRFGWPTTAFHLGPETSDIELAAPAVTAPQLAELESAVAAEIRSSRSVAARWVEPGDLATLPVRTRGLPDGHSGPVRLVEIAGVDLNTCGGTHVRSTAELEALCLLGTERLRGGTRLHFVAGGRVRARMRDHEIRSAGLRELLGAPDPELPSVLELKLGQLKDAIRDRRHLQERLAELLALDLARAPGPVVARRLQGPEGGLVRPVAARLAGSPGARAYLLVADDGAFALALTEELAAAAGEAAECVTKALDGRGGGRGPLYQGKCGHPERLGDAADGLRSLLE